MLVKIVTLFLIGMAVLAMFGRLRMPRLRGRATCRDCGAPRVGRGPCPCRKVPRA
ncbi:hypothetical protein [Jannaschia formosa]|uniref:hypothetical protein n=1 Tax=Jannaschia formosa TaxID=2259592 RepID=UPI0014312DD5|nr:hypothetical protein [Jannaschia formosa]